ncbi:hypothetical protein Syun_002828 [Stephania yunnanensis]|uniref:ENTH domain-containing protein n=1 Tax=Stephania yunnanensis TaxID=152371 RepID=A0AAP0L098_9MAGN
MVVDVQRKLRLALGSVKDHASIGKAMIYNRDGALSSIDISVVRATGHDNSPIEDRRMHEILFLVSNSPGSVSYLAERISHRLAKTQDPVVALKTLVLVHRLLRGGNRKFEQDLRNAHLSGHLQLSTITKWFSTSPHDHCSITFLHGYASFLEERLGWMINQAGKLQPIMFQGLEFRFYKEKVMEMAFHQLPRCQVFLGRVLRCSPLEIFTSNNCLSWAAMRNILRESFQVYASFSEGVAALADSFFTFTNNPARLSALQVLRKASSQSYELCNFFENCKMIIGTKNLDYPSVQIITSDHVSAMEEFLKSSSPPIATTRTLSSSLHAKTSTASAYRRTIDHNVQVISKPGKLSVIEEIEETEAMEGKESAYSSPNFSCKLETTISTEWVVFDNEEATVRDEEERMREHDSVVTMEMKECNEEEWSYNYNNPFESYLEIRRGDFKRS